MDIEKILNLQTLINHRRTIHQNPEIGLNTLQTTAYITGVLDQLSVQYELILTTKTAIIAYFPASCPSKESLAFRCDTDALEIKEETNIPYCSKNSGLMHACGHDGHSAIALGLAQVLTHCQLQKNVLIIFQPAEEGPGGAKPIVDSGIFKKYHITSIYGLHLNPYLPEGQLSINPGPTLASCRVFDLEIRGKSAHGTMPEEGIDAILIASILVAKIDQLKTKLHDQNYILHIQKFIGGSNNSIIAEKVLLKGTIRTFDDLTYQKIKTAVYIIIQDLVKQYQAKIY
ncbi:MAG: amidohydrolase [Acholeplasmatales bacterium]|jgi:amidohydrolase|nr:amidohydrolase [Acholeplasmatales bacterium]